jgi:hypothetical protein
MTKKKNDAIPNEFASYEEAAAFWDTHDTTKYTDALRPVEVVAKLKSRRFEIELDADVVKALRQRARRRKVPAKRLANDLLRQQLVSR